MSAFLTLANRILAALAGLLGAAGVAAAAAAAHGGFGDNLRTASEFALVHGALVLALTRGAPGGRLVTLAAALVLTGALLFCGDLALRALAKATLFPMAAPAGGFMMIAGWLVAGLDALTRLKSGNVPK